MKILVTGSAGHLGEALMLSLSSSPHEAIGLDLIPSPHTHHVGTIGERRFVRDCMRGIDVVLHTATLHKPHVQTHTRQDFVDINVTGTLTLLEAAVEAGVSAFVYTSTTSTFGRALIPPVGEPAAWITEEGPCVPKNIYGTTKVAAEQLCELMHVERGLPCVVLRTSRFFPEADDDPEARRLFDALNLKINELLYRRVDIEDVVSAHLLAMQKAPSFGFDRFIISATTPFTREDLGALRRDPASVVGRHVGDYATVYAARGWSMNPVIDRVYVNERARLRLGWQPRYDFAAAIRRLAQGEDPLSPLARQVGSKGYHKPRAG